MRLRARHDPSQFRRVPLVDAARFHAICRVLADDTGIRLSRVMKRRAYGGPFDRVPAAGVSFYLAHVVFGIGHSRLARLADCRRQSVHRAISRIEDRRDDPQFDQWLSGLEERLRSGRLVS